MAKIRIYESSVKTGNYKAIEKDDKWRQEASIKCFDFLNSKAMKDLSQSDAPSIETINSCVTSLFSLEDTTKQYSPIVIGCALASLYTEKTFVSPIIKATSDPLPNAHKGIKISKEGHCDAVKYDAKTAKGQALSALKTKRDADKDNTTGCKKGHDKAKFVHPYGYNDKHDMYYSRTVKTYKGYWKTETARLIDKEARLYFHNYYEGVEEIKGLKAHYDSGEDLLNDLAVTGSIAHLTKGVIKSIAKSGHIDKEGNYIPSHGSEACSNIICNYYHDDIYEDLEGAVALQLSEWLLDDSWKDYIKPDLMECNGQYRLQYGTYVTPRSQKTMPYYMKLMSCVRNELYKYSNKRITDLSKFMDKEEKREDTALDRANAILSKYENPYDIIEDEAVVKSFIAYIGYRCKDKTAAELSTLIKGRMAGLIDRDIAKRAAWSNDKVKNLSRKLKELVSMYKTEKSHYSKLHNIK